MPSSVTHNYFSTDVYKRINIRAKEAIGSKFNEYKVFAQGPDPYFFYDFHLTKRSKIVHEINSLMQHSKVNKHFSTLINYINEKKYYSDPLVMAYLYGQICHYALDTTCHPYIIYNSGFYDKDDENTYKYNGLQEEMEYYIDCYFIYNREKIMPKDYKAYKNLFCKMVFNDNLKATINDVSYSVYGFENVSDKYLKSINDMKKFYFIFNYDKWGIKKLIYSIMDNVCGDRFIRKKELSFFVDPLSKKYYLNLEKKEWYHPCLKNEKYNYSFLELYDMASDKAINIINQVDKMLSTGKVNNRQIERLFNNQNYGTGKDCDLKLAYNFFKF